MKIDVIIPLYRPGRELFDLLGKLQTQTVAVQNIILMNTEEQYFDELTKDCDFFGRFPNVQVHHLKKEEFDHGGTRHQAVQYSDAEVFVTMTQDAMPVNDRLLEELTQNLRGEVAVAYARQLPSEHSSELEKISRAFNYPDESRFKSEKDLPVLGIKTFFCSNVCAAYRREVYDRLGGFIRHTIFNEDMIFAFGVIRAGYRISYEAQAQVIHSHNYTNMQQLRRNFDLGVSQADHPEVFCGIASESEGMRLVKATWKDLKQRKKLRLFPGFCVQCACKLAGYKLGRNYRRLPRKLVLRLSDNKAYWKE